jgi:hypothetical protein
MTNKLSDLVLSKIAERSEATSVKRSFVSKMYNILREASPRAFSFAALSDIFYQ